MRKAETQGAARFDGVALNVARTALPGNLFQADEGGDGTQVGSWRRRRGMLRSNLPTLTGTPGTLIGFQTPGGEFVLAVAHGSTISGFSGVASQDFTPPAAAGFGQSGFGEEAFGE